MPTSAQSPSCVLLFAAPWTVVQQVPLSMGFSQQEYWSELSFPPPGIFLIQGSNSGILHLLHWQMDSFTTESPEKPHIGHESRWNHQSNESMEMMTKNWFLEFWNTERSGRLEGSRKNKQTNKRLRIHDYWSRRKSGECIALETKRRKWKGWKWWTLSSKVQIENWLLNVEMWRSSMNLITAILIELCGVQ